TGEISASQIATNTLSVSSDSLTIAGKSLSEYINNVIDARFATSITSPLAEIDQIKTNVISPLAQNSSIQIALGDSQITIVNSKTGQTVAAIDNSGNATFSGTLNSQDLNVN